MPKVLLIDDSKTIHKVASLILKGGLYKLSTAENSEEGERAALREKPDIALIDLTIGPLSGLELIRKFANHPDLKTIKTALLYGHFQKIDERQLKKAGGAGKLCKPFDSREFLKLLEGLINRGVPVTPPNQTMEDSEAPLGLPESIEGAWPIHKEEDLGGDGLLEPSESSSSGKTIEIEEGAEVPLGGAGLSLFSEKPEPAHTLPKTVAMPPEPPHDFKSLFEDEELEECLNFLEKPLTPLREPSLEDKEIQRPLKHVTKNPPQLDKSVGHSSREAIEKVCWEVIPPLAEKIIREEIQKLLKESD